MLISAQKMETRDRVVASLVTLAPSWPGSSLLSLLAIKFVSFVAQKQRRLVTLWIVNCNTWIIIHDPFLTSLTICWSDSRLCAATSVCADICNESMHSAEHAVCICTTNSSSWGSFPLSRLGFKQARFCSVFNQPSISRGQVFMVIIKFCFNLLIKMTL